MLSHTQDTLLFVLDTIDKMGFYDEEGRHYLTDIVLRRANGQLRTSEVMRVVRAISQEPT